MQLKGQLREVVCSTWRGGDFAISAGTFSLDGGSAARVLVSSRGLPLVYSGDNIFTNRDFHLSQLFSKRKQAIST